MTKYYKVYGKNQELEMKIISSGDGFKTKKEANFFAAKMKKYYKVILIF